MSTFLPFRWTWGAGGGLEPPVQRALPSSDLFHVFSLKKSLNAPVSVFFAIVSQSLLCKFESEPWGA